MQSKMVSASDGVDPFLLHLKMGELLPLLVDDLLGCWLLLPPNNPNCCADCLCCWCCCLGVRVKLVTTLGEGLKL